MHAEPDGQVMAWIKRNAIGAYLRCSQLSARTFGAGISSQGQCRGCENFSGRARERA